MSKRPQMSGLQVPLLPRGGRGLKPAVLYLAPANRVFVEPRSSLLSGSDVTTTTPSPRWTPIYTAGGSSSQRKHEGERGHQPFCSTIIRQCVVWHLLATAATTCSSDGGRDSPQLTLTRPRRSRCPPSPALEYQAPQAWIDPFSCELSPFLRCLAAWLPGSLHLRGPEGWFSVLPHLSGLV